MAELQLPVLKIITMQRLYCSDGADEAGSRPQEAWHQDAPPLAGGPRVQAQSDKRRQRQRPQTGNGNLSADPDASKVRPHPFQ
jgi:hypothetical protein